MLLQMIPVVAWVAAAASSTSCNTITTNMTLTYKNYLFLMASFAAHNNKAFIGKNYLDHDHVMFTF